MQKIALLGSTLLQGDNKIYIYFLLKYFIKYEFCMLENQLSERLYYSALLHTAWFNIPLAVGSAELAYYVSFSDQEQCG
jgi:hypothetical protein